MIKTISKLLHVILSMCTWVLMYRRRSEVFVHFHFIALATQNIDICKGESFWLRFIVVLNCGRVHTQKKEMQGKYV